MTPNDLLEYVCAAGVGISAIIWINIVILYFCGAFDRENKE